MVKRGQRAIRAYHDGFGEGIALDAEARLLRSRGQLEQARHAAERAIRTWRELDDPPHDLIERTRSLLN